VEVSTPQGLIQMIVESIPQDKPTSQYPYHGTSYAKVISPMQEGWLSLIKKYEPYDWFATLTFRDPVHVEVAEGRFKRWRIYIDNALYGGNFVKKRKGVTWFRAMERQKRGVLHFHCLIGSPDMYRLKRKDFVKAWETNCGLSTSKFRLDYGRFDKILAEPDSLDWLSNGFAMIHKYDPSKGADYYCSKYVTKGFDNLDVFVNPIQLKFINDKSQIRLL